MPFYMDLAVFERALDSLKGFPGKVGIIGGEPAMHPEFQKICTLLIQRIPPHKRAFWISGYKWDMHKGVIQKTFGKNV